MLPRGLAFKLVTVQLRGRERIDGSRLRPSVTIGPVLEQPWSEDNENPETPPSALRMIHGLSPYDTVPFHWTSLETLNRKGEEGEGFPTPPHLGPKLRSLDRDVPQC